MYLLLDTHTLIWFIEGDDRISTRAKDLVDDISNNCYVSIVSIWEMSIKWSQNKIKLSQAPSSLQERLDNLRIKLLPIIIEDFEMLETLPLYHRDPFDRLLISQAISRDLTIVSKDPFFAQYPCKTLW
jgi:PIN domain nuclease of toxin-antitoxin system